MIKEVLLPALGETMDSARIVRWLKQPGDRVAKGDPLFEIETDKATIEVEALSMLFQALKGFDHCSCPRNG